ncbi:response regulator [Niabella sp. CC-SYL272]|uniref:ATP-binding protein n=1 Tax=Niabella agricola TaxID=2891571 RepID=UPI001F2DF122|nr:ATP-binding protein [Niabella agricola]MCF3110843.1 response regulator [Niabella agricola]
MIGIMAILLLLELCILWWALGTLSATRAFVNGEGLWSKGQKNAVTSLLLYAHSRDESDYQDYLHFLKVPMGDRKLRLALSVSKPDIAAARLGMLEGRNHPEDIDGVIRLFLRFKKVSFLKEAIAIWSAADASLDQLIRMGNVLHDQINTASTSKQEIHVSLSSIKQLNITVTQLEDDFSRILGAGARWLERMVLWLVLALSLTIGTISLLIAISVSRSIVKGAREIIRGTGLVSEGVLNTRIQVYSGDEIGRLAQAFNQMIDKLEHNLHQIQQLEDTGVNLKREKERAEASEKTKQLFLAKMSHEIRTPMNAILGFARLLEDSLTTREQQEYIRIIIKSGDSLLVILNDILDFSRMEAGKIVFENAPFSPRDIVHTAKLMMEPRARQKGLNIDCAIDRELPEKLMGDSVRLNQVLLNLLSNAIKFTTRGEIRLSVRLTEAREDDCLVEFEVADTGIGIPAAQQERIFESFEQVAHTRAHRFGGIGLGLSIVKQLIEMQRGVLFVDSKPGYGSRFYFRLSFRRCRETEPAVIEYTGIIDTDCSGIRVLVAEDNKINQMLVIKVLKKQGFETVLAENGLAVLEKYRQGDFDVILMDLQMPVMDGYEAAQRIRLLGNGKNSVPIIALSAHTIQGEYERCMAVGINDFISKPFNREELYSKILRLVRDKKPESFSIQ